MNEFGQMWRLVSKEDYDKFQQSRALEKVSQTENLRELLKECWSAAQEYEWSDHAVDVPDFNEWFEKRFG